MGNFESEMKDMFDGVEFQPSERVWAGVEKAINEKKKKGIFFMWQTYGIAAAIALFITAGMLYKNGFFSGQPNPTPSTKQLAETKSEEQVSTDSLENDKGLNNQLLAKEGDTATDVKAADVSIPQENASLLANNGSKQINDRIDNELTTDQVDQTIRTESLLAQSTVEGLSEQPLFDMDKAQIKPYQPSLASTRAKWLSGLGVDESALASLFKVAEDEPEFVAENSLNGRLGSNNFNIGAPANGLALEARAADANFQAFSNIQNREEETLGSVSAGIGFSTELNKRLQFNANLRYSEMRVKTTSNAYSVHQGNSYPIYLSNGYDPDNVNFVGTYDVVNTLQGLSLQPTISYKIAQVGKFDFSVLGGVGLDYFFAYRIKGDLNFLSVSNANLDDSNFIQKYNLSGISGVGVNYRLNEHFGIGADFNYRYFIPTGNSENRRQSSVIGFGLGVNYFLQKRD